MVRKRYIGPKIAIDISNSVSNSFILFGIKEKQLPDQNI